MIEDLASSKQLPLPLPAALDELKVELWLYLLLQRSSPLISDQDIEHFQFAADIRRYYDTLQPVQRQEVAQLVYSCQEIRSCVLWMVNRSPERCWNLALVGRLAALQPLLENPGLQLDEVIDRCSAETPQQQQQPGLVLALKRLIRESGQLETKHWLPLLDYALRLIDPLQPVYLRHQAAELCDLLIGSSHLAIEQMTSNVEVMGRFMRLVLLLLLDEAEWVRHRAAQLVASSKFQRELGQEVTKGERNVLPSALIPEFLNLMLAQLQKQGGGDKSFLQRLFQLIAEPFFPKESNVEMDMDAEDVEVFDKQEINLYCESMMVLSEISTALRERFKEESQAVDLPVSLVLN